MARHSVECSIMQLLDKVGRNASAAITIRYSNTNDGKQILECWKLKRSSHCHMCQCHIHLWKDLSVASGESYLIKHCFGLRLISRTSFRIISAITTVIVLILDEMVKPLWNHGEEQSSLSIIIDGRGTAAVCLNYLWLLELRFRQEQVKNLGGASVFLPNTPFILLILCNIDLNEALIRTKHTHQKRRSIPTVKILTVVS